MSAQPLGFGLYGVNGHQIHSVLASHPDARLVAVAAFSDDAYAQLPPSVRRYDSLDELLADSQVQAVSLCSPYRRDQADDAIKSLRAGKHVYAEKPCALNESDLDRIVATAKETGVLFREMAGTAFGQPYYAMREIVASGILGEIVQVISEKSYPYMDWRPQDEDRDGGLITQNAIHAFRFIEHVAGLRIKSVQAIETTLGNPVQGGGLRMASALIAGLENGGVASVAANYLNQRGTGVWGYELLRILGTQGMIESTQGGQQTRMVIGDQDHGPLDVTKTAPDYLALFILSALGENVMPFSLEDELSPTRWVLRAKQSASI